MIVKPSPRDTVRVMLQRWTDVVGNNGQTLDCKKQEEQQMITIAGK